MLATSPEGRLEHFNRVGIIAALATALSLWLAGRVRPASETKMSVHEVTEEGTPFAEMTTLPAEMSESTLDYPADEIGAESFHSAGFDR
jgi:hypothetical protein